MRAVRLCIGTGLLGGFTTSALTVGPASVCVDVRADYEIVPIF